MADPDFDRLKLRYEAFDGNAIRTLRAVNELISAKLEESIAKGDAGAEIALRLHAQCSGAIGKLRLLDGRPEQKAVRGARWAAQYVFAILLSEPDAAECYARAATAAFAEYDCAPEATLPGVIYFVRHIGGDEIKIGFALEGNLDARLRALKTAMPRGIELLASMPGTMMTEAELHSRFSSNRVSANNEWFHATPDLMALIDSLRRS